MAKLHVNILSILLVLVLSNHVAAQGLKVNGTMIVDGTGKEVILRGMGLGGWMIQEGYMMETSDFAGPQHEIKAKIRDLIGQESTDEFYRKWHQNHCTRRDIDSLASWGFNSIRVPMHYNLFTLPIEEEPVADSNTWLVEGFQLIDSLVKWCSEDHIYVILDLHAAPGGQGRDANISDYDPSKPSLWESTANKNKTIALWKKLAERYAAEPWIGGYDLINETNWNFTAGGNQNGCSENTNAPLKQLLKDITTAIRLVDNQHIIIIEGNCWGNNYNGVLPPWDNNMVVSFHKYWSMNDQNSIQGMLSIRSTHNIPIWLGESGENSNPWFTDAIRLVEKNYIGWAWWPLKKVGSVVNPLTIPKNSGYQALLNYWKNGGTKPTAEFAKAALMQLAENARNENCIFRKDVIDAMFRQVYDPTVKPFTETHLPGVVKATDFDLGEIGKAYYDKDAYDYHVTTGTYTSWNTGWSYRNDAVDIESSEDSDPASNGYNIGWSADDEWTQYTVEVDSSAAYSVFVRYANGGSVASQLRIQSEGADVATTLSLPNTGGYKTWSYVPLSDVILYKGTQHIKLYFEKGGANLGFVKFNLSRPITEVEFQPILAETKGETEVIALSLNKEFNPATLSQNGWSCTVNGSPAEIASLTINPDNPRQLLISLKISLYDGDVIKLNYSGTSLLATDQTLLQAFTNFPVLNNLPVHFPIPGKIEAESFSVNNGLQLETTTDAGGGQNIGYTNTGDYLEYRVRVSKAASYKVEVREACLSTPGTIEIQQLDENHTLLNTSTLSIPVTGGWQTWRSIEGAIKLNAGTGILKVKIIKPEFNLNWYKFTAISVDTTVTKTEEFKIYPNPVENTKQLKIDVPDSEGKQKSLQILSMNGDLIREESLELNALTSSISLDQLSAGVYIVEVRTDSSTWRSKLVIL